MLGRGRRHTIGRAGIVTLADARAEAKRLVAQKTLGLIKKKTPITFGKARETFVDEHYADKRPRVKKEAKRLLEKHFATLDKLSLSDVGDAELSRELDKLKRRPGEQLHAFRVCRTFLSWCVKPPRRYIPHSPLEGYAPPTKDGTNDRILSLDELKKIWLAAEGSFGALVQLLILTSARKMEIGALRWDWLVDGVLTIPGEARKNHKSLVLPLGPLARSIMDAQPKKGSYVFPGRLLTDTHINPGSFGKPKRALDLKSGVSGYGLHSLRKTTATNMASFTPPHILQAILGHSSGPVSQLQALYNKYEYLEEKRAALQLWEEKLISLLPGAL
jgi:integrase